MDPIDPIFVGTGTPARSQSDKYRVYGVPLLTVYCYTKSYLRMTKLQAVTIDDDQFYPSYKLLGSVKEVPTKRSYTYRFLVHSTSALHVGLYPSYVH